MYLNSFDCENDRSRKKRDCVGFHEILEAGARLNKSGGMNEKMVDWSYVCRSRSATQVPLLNAGDRTDTSMRGRKAAKKWEQTGHVMNFRRSWEHGQVRWESILSEKRGTSEKSRESGEGGLLLNVVEGPQARR